MPLRNTGDIGTEWNLKVIKGEMNAARPLGDIGTEWNLKIEVD